MNFRKRMILLAFAATTFIVFAMIQFTILPSSDNSLKYVRNGVVYEEYEDDEMVHFLRPLKRQPGKRTWEKNG